MARDNPACLRTASADPAAAARPIAGGQPDKRGRLTRRVSPVGWLFRRGLGQLSLGPAAFAWAWAAFAWVLAFA